MKHFGFPALVCSILLSACMAPAPAVTDAGPYAGIPILSRETYELRITGELDSCYGMEGTPRPCFVGLKPSGDRVTFDDGISGYTFREGVEEVITVEEIAYDFSHPNALQDASSIRYVLVP